MRNKRTKRLVGGAFTAATLVGLTLMGAGPAQAGADKVKVCHGTGNGDVIIIEVARKALDAHLAHGDQVSFKGVCYAPDPGAAPAPPRPPAP